MKILMILNDPAYGTERSYNGLRLAGALTKRDDTEVRVFLMGDAVGCAMANQKVPNGYYHLDRMILSAVRHGAEVGCCGTCMEARGIDDDRLTTGARPSTLKELADWRCGPTRSSPSNPTEPAVPDRTVVGLGARASSLIGEGES